jgi:hypothetical protein
MKIQIKHRYTSAVLFEHECDDNTMEKTLRAAIDAGANLSDADMGNAYLRYADLHGSNLRGVNLSNADLYGSNLYGSNLGGADLSGVNLSNANLRGSNLYGAYLSGAVIDGLAIPSETETAPLLRQVAQSALAASDALDMGRWHTCETVHCIAGWAIALSGEKGRELEDQYGSANAGMLLLGVEAATHFYDDNETARNWLRSILEAVK